MGAGPGHVFPNASTLGRGMKAWEGAGTRGGKQGTVEGGAGHVGMGGGGSGANVGNVGNVKNVGEGPGGKGTPRKGGASAGRGPGGPGSKSMGGGPGGPGSGSAKQARAFAAAIGPVPIETPPLF